MWGERQKRGWGGEEAGENRGERGGEEGWEKDGEGEREAFNGPPKPAPIPLTPPLSSLNTPPLPQLTLVLGVKFASEVTQAGAPPNWKQCGSAPRTYTSYQLI